jgi:hypothetical protein
MADSPSVETQGTERFSLGVISTPDGVEAYSQKFEGGKLVREDRDIFLGKGMIEENSSDKKIEEIVDDESESSQNKSIGSNLKDSEDNAEVFTQRHQIPPKK